MDVQTSLGVGLFATIRLQLNLKIQQLPRLKQFSGLPSSLKPDETMLIPVLWFDDTIDDLPVWLVVLLKDALSMVNSSADAMLCLVLIILVLSWAMYLGYQGWKKTSAEKTDDAAARMTWSDVQLEASSPL